MGFLSSLFNSAKKAGKPKEEAAPTKESELSIPAPRKQSNDPSAKSRLYTLKLEGDSERRIYTYDGTPLKGTRKGSVLFADVITEPTRLYSEATGSEWDSSDGGVALAVNGIPFGMTSTMEQTFKELAEAGYAVKVKVKRLGMYCEGIPEMVLMIPEPSEVFHWRDACRALGREVPFEERHSDECERAAGLENERHRLSRLSGLQLPIGVDGDVFSISDGDWPGLKPPSGYERIEVSTEIIPTPKGSTAKPHIVVSTSGQPFVELTARNHQYQAMSRHVGEIPYAATCQRRTRDDGTFFWQVAVIYLSQEDERIGSNGDADD